MCAESFSKLLRLGAAALCLLLTLQACTGGQGSSSTEDDDLMLVRLSHPITISAICGYVLDAAAEEDRACVNLVRPINFEQPPLGVVHAQADLAKLEGERDRLRLTAVGCGSGKQKSITGLGLVPSSQIASNQWTAEELCGSLPDAPVGSSTVGDFGRGTSPTRALFQQCADDLAASGEGPVRGPETISEGVGSAVRGFGIGIAVDLALKQFKNLSPEEKIAVGAALLLVAGPTIFIIGEFAAVGLAGEVVAATGAALAGSGASMLEDGVAEKAGSSSTGPSPGGSETQGTTPGRGESPGPDGAQSPGAGATGTRPDSDGATMPQSCADALATMTACLGKRVCETELARELEMLRQHLCQTDKAFVDPDSNYCSGAAPSDEQLAVAVVSLCQEYWSDRRPDPDAPMACPMLSALSRGGLAAPISEVCLHVVSDNDFTCPDLPGEPAPGGWPTGGPFPQCPPFTLPAECLPPDG